jgi:hypothetical protein
VRLSALKPSRLRLREGHGRSRDLFGNTQFNDEISTNETSFGDSRARKGDKAPPVFENRQSKRPAVALSIDVAARGTPYHHDDEYGARSAFGQLSTPRHLFCLSLEQHDIYAYGSSQHLINASASPPRAFSTQYPSFHISLRFDPYPCPPFPHPTLSVRRDKIFTHINGSTSTSIAVVGNGSSNLCSTLGCRMPNVPMRVALPAKDRKIAAAWPGRYVGSEVHCQ